MAEQWYVNFNVLGNELDEDDYGLERHLHGDRLQPSRHPQPTVELASPTSSAIWAKMLAGQRRAMAAAAINYPNDKD